MNRQQLLESYIEEIIDGMDHKSMYQYVWDNLYDHLNKYDEEELVEEVKDCLLYTSPSPRDMRRARMPSSA